MPVGSLLEECEADEDEAEAERGGAHAKEGERPDLVLMSPLLRPLVREWQSARLGHVFVDRRLDKESAADETQLFLWVAGEGSRYADPIGRLAVEGGHVVLEAHSWSHDWRCSTRLWLDATRSKGRWIVWEDSSGNPFDSWDGCFLDTARKAASWVEESYELQSWLVDGLPHLRGGAETSYSSLTVGLCITTMNRLWQLRRALPLNLVHCWPHRRWVRIHVVDFGSSDGTMDFLLSRCRAAIECGLLCVYTAELQFWHASVAKNTSHMVSREDILVNCDGDNLLGPDFPLDVVRRFSEGASGLQYEGGPGTCGRIACWREHFDEIRGYDEDCYPMGAQDVDLIHRLQALPGANFQRVISSLHSHAIPNTQHDKIRNCSPLYGQVRWGRMDTINRQIFKWRLDKGQVARNLDRPHVGVPARRMHPAGLRWPSFATDPFSRSKSCGWDWSKPRPAG